MRLLRLDEVQITERDQVFRYSHRRALLVTVAVISASGGLILLGWHQDFGLAYYNAGVLLLALVLMRRFILARFRPSNWLARINDEGLLVQFRSYLNYHFPKEDLTVVFVPFGEIRSVRLVRQRGNVPDTDESGSRLDSLFQAIRRLVELELTGDLTPLARALTNEFAGRGPKESRWYGTTTTRYQHYPARMASDTVLQLEWKVVPSSKVFLDVMQRHTNVATPVEVSEDYAHLELLNREEQEKRLLELVETGQTIAAIRIARRLYSYDLTEAKAFVDGLRGGKTRGSASP